MNIFHVRLVASVGYTVLALAMTLIFAPPDAVVDDGQDHVAVTAVDQSVRVIVLGPDGRLDDVWSNTSTAPDVVAFRNGAVNGPDVVPVLIKSTATSLDTQTDWGRRGLVWRRSSD